LAAKNNKHIGRSTTERDFMVPSFDYIDYFYL
jgi:hypothetical protein